MPAFSFDGPGEPGCSFVTTEQAARWIGVGDTTFLRMVGHKKDQPGKTLPGVAEWMRPYDHGQKDLWDVQDVIMVRHILVRRRAAGLATPTDDDEEEKRGKS